MYAKFRWGENNVTSLLSITLHTLYVPQGGITAASASSYIMFNVLSDPCRASIEKYLLEKSRIVSQAPGERYVPSSYSILHCPMYMGLKTTTGKDMHDEIAVLIHVTET